ncbi:aldo/keto reductase [Microlunatus speluncae]|uniref:aldo/keto reductase n=1 Tax=Microlunatus speluncae TaxID=2594267 RepID=UPI001C2D51F3|nr:aldo/keto reductase [Microlunatus speluncae]
MKTRILHSGGRTLEVTALCLGVMYLGVREDERTSYEVLDRFYEHGGRFFDTANNYGGWTEASHGSTSGDSERLLGRWIADRGVAGEIVVSTKCGAGKRDPERTLSMELPTNFEGLSAEVVRSELKGSLERLGLDRVGVYIGHVDDRDLDATEIADTFSALADEGLITVPGLSNTATWRLALARRHSGDHGRPEFGVWQQHHSLYWPVPGVDESTRVTPEAVDYAADQPELTIMTYSPQQGGQLARPWMPIQDCYNHPGSEQRLRRAHQIAHELGATVNQVVMAWHLAGVRSSLHYVPGSHSSPADALPARRAAMIPVFSASSAAQVDEAVGAVTLDLPPDHLSALDTP